MRCDSPVVLSLGVEDVRRRRWSNWKGWPDEIQVSVGFNAKNHARAIFQPSSFHCEFDGQIDEAKSAQKRASHAYLSPSRNIVNSWPAITTRADTCTHVWRADGRISLVLAHSLCTLETAHVSGKSVDFSAYYSMYLYSGLLSPSSVFSYSVNPTSTAEFSLCRFSRQHAKP